MSSHMQSIIVFVF